MCKVLWGVRPTGEFKATADDPQLMIRYFAMIEADCKDYIPCYVCFKLHRKQREEAGGEHPGRPKGGRRMCELQVGEARFCMHYALYYKVVLLALRAHKRGPAYGIPLGKLEHNCTLYNDVSVHLKFSKNLKYASQNVAFSISPQITTEMGPQLRLKWQYCITLTNRWIAWSQDKYPTVEGQIEQIYRSSCGSSSGCHLADVARSAVWHARTPPLASNEGCPHSNQPWHCAYSGSCTQERQFALSP